MPSANNSVAEGSKHDFSIGITKPTQDEVVVYFDKASPSQIKAMTATWKLGTNFSLCFSGRVFIPDIRERQTHFTSTAANHLIQALLALFLNARIKNCNRPYEPRGLRHRLDPIEF